MLLYQLPKEINFSAVTSDFNRHYPKADKMGKIQYRYWRHICECLNGAGQLCPTFKSFLLTVKQTDLIEAVSNMIISLEGIGSKKEGMRIIHDYYERKTVNNVIYVDFRE